MDLTDDSKTSLKRTVDEDFDDFSEEIGEQALEVADEPVEETTSSLLEGALDEEDDEPEEAGEPRLEAEPSSLLATVFDSKIISIKLIIYRFLNFNS